MEIIIRNAEIVDGGGGPSYRGDIGINADRIEIIGNLSNLKAEKEIDANGLVAAPGFIDIHSHSDFTLPINPLAESKIRQGVTTEVVGNCGSSPAPLNSKNKQDFFIENPHLPLVWESFGQYLESLSTTGLAVNVVPLVGHSTIRSYAIGFVNRPPTNEELLQMNYVIAQALEEGAWGMSTGLIYPPGSYAATNELIELSRGVARRGGFYFSHIRGESSMLLDSIQEAIKIGETAGISVQIAHLKAVREENWHLLPMAIQLIEQARARGVDLMADRYPYTAASNSLADQLPKWSHEGGHEALLARLGDPSERKRILNDLSAMNHPWEKVFVSYSPNSTDLEGQTVKDIAEQRSMDPDELVLQILEETKVMISIVDFVMSEENLRTVLKHPLVMLGSDGEARKLNGPLGEGRPHPRSYGTFPRLLGRYVREERLLSLPEAVFKMSGMPAARLGITDRGRLSRGMRADLVLFDPNTVIDRASFTEPHRYPLGIQYVLVNGRLVITPAGHTGALPGRILAR